jgi:hypothetical protein
MDERSIETSLCLIIVPFGFLFEMALARSIHQTRSLSAAAWRRNFKAGTGGLCCGAAK